MGVTRFSAETIATLLREKGIATMPELLAALGTNVERTVFRKLNELSYHTSYSHRGRYYVLDDDADFDPLGLWSCESVWFSSYGTLLSTAEAIVGAGEQGCFVEELDNTLHVMTKDALRRLVSDGRLARERVGGQYLYCSADLDTKRRQLLGRKTLAADRSMGAPLPDADMMPDELKAAIILFFSLLDEKMRRLYTGIESLKLGHGGDRKVADLFGVAPGTVARGRSQLLSRDIEVDRVRRTGAGRPALEKKRRK
ncbi:hypothetical protein H8D79_01690 [PVC group bacterium]|nr:hypothetical protein [PVC group bacterium]